MTVQNYCTVDTSTNTCENITLWDGNPDTWAPPAGKLMLVHDATTSKVWEWDEVNKIWALGIQTGLGGIGFTWDGVYLITNEPEPTLPLLTTVLGQAQPTNSGVQQL